VPDLETPPLGVILTGGRATRLRPLSDGMPKSLIPLLNRPLIAYSLDLLFGAGIREVVVVVGGQDDRTGPAAREAAPAGMTVHVAVQAEPRGSGDALLAAGAHLDGRHVVVAAVDTVLRGDEGVSGSLGAQVRAFLTSGTDAWYVLHETDRPKEMGIVVLEGQRVLHLEEKPAEPRSNLALVGIWMVSPRAVERLRANPALSIRGEIELSGTLATMHAEGFPMGGAEYRGDWLDTGTLASLLATQRALLDVPALIAPDATVEGSTLGLNVVVGAGAVVRNCTLRDVLVAPGAHIDGVVASNEVITADGTRTRV
jgi:glucose-1-phosphate thymidylyltransferase